MVTDDVNRLKPCSWGVHVCVCVCVCVCVDKHLLELLHSFAPFILGKNSFLKGYDETVSKPSRGALLVDSGTFVPYNCGDIRIVLASK